MAEEIRIPLKVMDTLLNMVSRKNWPAVLSMGAKLKELAEDQTGNRLKGARPSHGEHR